MIPGGPSEEAWAGWEHRKMCVRWSLNGRRRQVVNPHSLPSQSQTNSQKTMALPNIVRAIASAPGPSRFSISRAAAPLRQGSLAAPLPSSRRFYSPQYPLPNPPPTTALPDEPSTAAKVAATATEGVNAAAPSAPKSKSTTSGPFTRIVYWSLFLFGSTFLVTYYLDSRSAIHRWVAMPFLHSFVDPEDGQKLAIDMLKSGLSPKDYTGEDDTLKTEVRIRRVIVAQAIY